MPAAVTHPTPYPDVNVVLHELLSGVQSVLGDQLVGMYLSGSLAGGDFDPASSDIDFLVVTADVLPEELLLALASTHARIAAGGSKWATKLEGSYIPRQALRRYDPSRARHPSIGVDWSFGVSQHGSDWVLQRHIIREQGVVLAGPPPQSLIDPVQPLDVRRAVLATLREWWSRQLDDPDWLRAREYQAFAILTMCRALYTLQHGTVVSKPVAARWARSASGGLGERWAALIDQALAWRGDTRPDDLDDTLDFIRYTLERARRFALPSDDA